jgi:hypothetical protein
VLHLVSLLLLLRSLMNLQLDFDGRAPREQAWRSGGGGSTTTLTFSRSSVSLSSKKGVQCHLHGGNEDGMDASCFVSSVVGVFRHAFCSSSSKLSVLPAKC